MRTSSGASRERREVVRAAVAWLSGDTKGVLLLLHGVSGLTSLVSAAKLQNVCTNDMTVPALGLLLDRGVHDVILHVIGSSAIHWACFVFGCMPNLHHITG